MKQEKKNRHEKAESKSFEKKEKMQGREPEYKTGKKNYKGKSF